MKDTLQTIIVGLGLCIIALVGIPLVLAIIAGLMIAVFSPIIIIVWMIRGGL